MEKAEETEKFVTVTVTSDNFYNYNDIVANLECVHKYLFWVCSQTLRIVQFCDR